MTWIGRITSITPTSTGLEVGVMMSDQVSQKLAQTFQTDGSLLSLRNQVRQRTVIADEIYSKPEYRVGDALDLSVDVADQPVDDPAADARATFFAAYRLYQAMVRGQAAGLVAPDAVTQQQSVMAKLYDPSYESSL